MRKYITTISAFIIMLCLGGVYGWSIIASELIKTYNFSSAQTQMIFGALIAIFPLTMIFVPLMAEKFKLRYLLYISVVFFSSGYILASLSDGKFIPTFIGISLLSGIATGIGYWVSLTIPVQWFPHRKGLITGIAAAGFGLGAILLSNLANMFIEKYGLLQFFLIISMLYGVLIFLASHGIWPPNTETNTSKNKDFSFFKKLSFYNLFMGIFLGTFSGLLVIGSLKMIGLQFNIPNYYLVLGVSLFAFFNFLGRLFWGFLSDYIGASATIFIALSIQGLSILSLELFNLTPTLFLVLSILIGFGFGGNFVLFAKETAQIFGVNLLGNIYPYVFLGYAFAGIMGPLTGGVLYDIFGNYTLAIFCATSTSLIGAIVFLINHFKLLKTIAVPKN